MLWFRAPVASGIIASIYASAPMTTAALDGLEANLKVMRAALSLAAPITDEMMERAAEARGVAPEPVSAPAQEEDSDG